MRLASGIGIVCLLTASAAAEAKPETPPVPAPPTPADAPAPEAAPPPPLARYENGTMISGYRSGGFVSLTFDDGPDYTATPAILDALDQYAVKATFFVCGYRFGGKSETAKKNQAVLADIVKRGHIVGNHTWNHLVLPQQTDKKMASEIDRNAALIEKHTGIYPFLFRAPFGSVSKRLTKALKKRKITHALWSSDSGDTRKPFKTEKVHRLGLQGILKHDGGVVLFHDTHSWTAKAVPLILADLEKENCARIDRGEPPIEMVQLDHFYIPAAGERSPDPPEVAANRAHWRKTLDDHCAAQKLSAQTAPPPPPTK